MLFEIILLKMNLSFEHYLCLWILNMFGHRHVNVYDYKILCLQLNFCQKSIIFLFANAYALLRAIQAFESKTACTNLYHYPRGLGRFLWVPDSRDG